MHIENRIRAQAERERLPPYSEEAERALIGSLLLDFRVVDIVREHNLDPEAFYVPAHRTLFAAIMACAEKKQTSDIITVIEELGSDGIDKVGGHLFMDNIIENTPTAAHCEHYLEIVKDDWDLRSQITSHTKAIAQCFEDHANSDDIIANHTRTMAEIEARKKRVEDTWAETVDKSMSTVELILGSDNHRVGLSTGYEALDKSVLGMKPGEMIVVAARPSMGKTSLAMNISENVAKDGNDVGIFSLEMELEELAFRMKCAHAEVNGHYLLKKERISPSTLPKMVHAAMVLRKYPFHCDSTPGLDIAQLRLRARRWKAKHDIKLIVIDYIQLMHSREYARQGRQLEVTHISSQLKEMAKELHIPVMVLSQLSRKMEDRDSKNCIPRISDLRDSGAIEQDADQIWLLRRPIKYEQAHDYSLEDKLLTKINIGKNRGGPTGWAHLDFHETITKFKDRIHVEQTEAPL